MPILLDHEPDIQDLCYGANKKTRQKGNLFVVFDIEMPDKLNPAAYGEILKNLPID